MMLLREEKIGASRPPSRGDTCLPPFTRFGALSHQIGTKTTGQPEYSIDPIGSRHQALHTLRRDRVRQGLG
jgi:hypothetical protein